MIAKDSGPVAQQAGAPRGVVAILVGNDGRQIATSTEFCRAAPAGFSLREFQEIQARRCLAMATMRELSSPRLADHIDLHTAEQIVGAMCRAGCSVVIVPVGYDE